MAIGLIAFSSCRDDEFSTPEPEPYVATFPVTTTIYELKYFIYDGNATGMMKIDTAITIEGVVTANDLDGNQYKSIIIQDTTAAIKISIDSYELHNKYPLGAHVKIQLQGMYIGLYSSLLQLGWDVEGAIGRMGPMQAEEYIFRTDQPYTIEVPTVKITDLNATRDYYKIFWLDTMQVSNSDLDEHFADAEFKIDGSVMLEDKNKRPIKLITSGYCDYAGALVPQGSGKLLIVYMGAYKGMPQANLRSFSEFSMNNKRFGPIYEKDFEDQSITSAGGTSFEGLTPNGDSWQNHVVTGKYQWTTSNQGGSDYYAMISNFNNGNTASEAWLISPAFNLTNINEPYLKFSNACNYNGDPLRLKISTDYNGTGAPADATWTDIPFSLSSGAWAWVSSGDIDLTPYAAGGKTYIAFVYTGSNSNGKTWEIDDLGIYETEVK